MFVDFLKRHKVEMIEAYIAGMVCFMCMSCLQMDWIGSAIVLGIANTYLVSPVVKALKLGNTSDEDILKVNHRKTLLNIIKAICISAILIIFYYFINKYVFPTGVEPITFGIFFKIIDCCLIKAKDYLKFKTATK